MKKTREKIRKWLKSSRTKGLNFKLRGRDVHIFQSKYNNVWPNEGQLMVKAIVDIGLLASESPAYHANDTLETVLVNDLRAELYPEVRERFLSRLEAN